MQLRSLPSLPPKVQRVHQARFNLPCVPGITLPDGKTGGVREASFPDYNSVSMAGALTASAARTPTPRRQNRLEYSRPTPRPRGGILNAGERLRDLRTRLGITTRDVEVHSREIAEKEKNPDFYISNAWLTQIENKGSTPSIYKLYTLSAIYRISLYDLLSLYGVEPDKAAGHTASAPVPRTHLLSMEMHGPERTVNFPVRFDPGFRTDQTNLISRMVEIWGEVPIGLIQNLDLRKGQWGYVGASDYTMHPMLRPGSFVQIDHRQTKIQPRDWRTEYDRPIFFLELRDGYACGWCELHGGRLTLIPHPLAPCGIRQFQYPNEADVVGRVTAVAMRLVDIPPKRTGGPARLPRQS